MAKAFRKKIKVKPSKSVSAAPIDSIRDDAKEKGRQRAREYYRRNKTDNFEMAGCLRSLTYYKDMAEQMEVFYGDLRATIPGYLQVTVADLLQMSYQSLWRQTTSDPAMIPPPVLKAWSGKRELMVYHRDEVAAMIRIIGEHKRQFAYYRKDHTETRDTLFAAIHEVRKQWEKDSSWHASPQVAKQPPPPKKRRKLKRSKP